MDIQTILAALKGQAPASKLGSGMAQQAAQSIQNRPYQMHVQEAQALGQQPMTLDEFMAQMQAGQIRGQKSGRGGLLGY